MTLNLQHCNKKDFDAHIKLYPSEKIYYDEYPYRVDIKGPGYPDPLFDPEYHYEITDFMRSCNMFYKRESHTQSGRRIYFGLYDDLLWFTNFMGDNVKAIHGPVSKDHITLMSLPGVILRNNLFFGKYDYRVELYTHNHWNRSTRSVFTQDHVDAVIKFVEANFDQYRWGTKEFKWFYNYLYCTKEEYDALEGFINLQFKHMIRWRDQVVLFSEL